MLNIPEYRNYSGETKIALMDNSTVAFLEQVERAGIYAKELQKSGGKAQKLFAIIGQLCRILSKCCTGNCSLCACVLVCCMIYWLYQ